jgi:Kef-type K+ transport system membrane component KefB
LARVISARLHGLIIDVALCIIAAWVVAVICQFFKQPLLLAYLAAGFAVGPRGFRWVTDDESIKTISEIGLILLLFLIGLEMDLKKMLGSGKAIFLTATAQIFGCVALGWLFFGLFAPGAGWLQGLYLGVAAAMSSTVIIVKLLYDKRELETLAGRITVGMLVLQDLFVILFLAIQPNLKDPQVAPLALAFGKVILLVGVAYGVGRFLLPPIFKFVQRQPELVMVGALAWCFAMAGFANYLGLSREMGALIAGVIVSTFPYTLDVVAKVTSIRDFFVTLFFVDLGMQIPVPTFNFIYWMLVFSAFVVGSRLITVFPVLYKMRLGHRVSLLPAINLCQISELSLVLLTLGKNSGDVSENSISIVAFAFAFLAVDSTYAIMRNETILRKASPWLRKVRLPDLPARESDTVFMQRPARIFMLGFSWTASSLLEEISREKPALLNDLVIVDYNPQASERLRARGVRVVYGDISQRDTLHHAGIEHAEVIVCSLPDTVLKGASNRRLLRQLRDLSPAAQIVVHAEKIADVHQLYAEGANYVSVPRLLEATELLKVLHAAENKLLDEKRKEQAEQLEERNEVIP